MMEKNRSESIAMQFAKAEMQANLIERGYAGHKLTDDQFMILMSKPTQDQVKSVLAALDRSEAVEAVAKSWAAIDGKLDSFLAGKAGNDEPGHFEGYVADATTLLEYLEKRSFKVVSIYKKDWKAIADERSQKIVILKGAQKADDERMLAASAKVWPGGENYGCDTYDTMADEILVNRQRIADLERQLAEATTWGSPETAPMDGAEILGLFDLESTAGPQVYNTWFEDGYWVSAFNDYLPDVLMGWLPLPKEGG